MKERFSSEGNEHIFVLFWKVILWYFALGNYFKSKCKLGKYFYLKWQTGEIEVGDIQFQMIWKLFYWETVPYVGRAQSHMSNEHLNFLIWNIFNPVPLVSVVLSSSSLFKYLAKQGSNTSIKNMCKTIILIIKCESTLLLFFLRVLI